MEQFLIKAGMGLAILVVGFVIARIVKHSILKLINKTNDTGVLSFVASCVSIFIQVISVVVMLSSWGMDLNIIVGAFSAMGLGISLALKENMANVAGGLQILLTRPFVLHDYIRLGSDEGTVTRIEVMFTVLTTPSMQEVIIPNSMIVQDVLINYSREINRRIHIQIPIPLEADMDVMKSICEEILDQEDLVLDDQPKEVVVESFQDRSMVFGVFAWTKTADYWTCLYRINDKIQKKRQGHGIAPVVNQVQIKSNDNA